MSQWTTLRSWEPTIGLIFEIGKDYPWAGIRWRLRPTYQTKEIAYSGGAFYDNEHPDYASALDWAEAATRAFWTKRGAQFTDEVTP